MQEERGTTEYEMAGWHHQLDGHEFEWTLGVGDGQGCLACCSLWGCNDSDTTEQLNWTESFDILITWYFVTKTCIYPGFSPCLFRIVFWALSAMLCPGLKVLKSSCQRKHNSTFRLCIFLSQHHIRLFYFDVGYFLKSYWIGYNIASVLCFGSLAARHMAS